MSCLAGPVSNAGRNLVTRLPEANDVCFECSSQAPIVSDTHGQPDFSNHKASIAGQISASSKMSGACTQTDGDTQPISQHIYDEFTSKSKPQQSRKQSSEPDEGLCGTRECTGKTYQEGDTGHVNLVGVMEPPLTAELADHATNQADIDLPSQSADVRAEIYPEFQRFQAPKTPAIGSKKRDQVLEIASDNDAPRLPVNPFAGQMVDLRVMNLSEAFEATQAVSSPLNQAFHPDGLSERPSPDMLIVRRAATASSFSSPSRILCSSNVRPTAEPQTTYISMKESQDERQKLIQERKNGLSLGRPDLSDDDFVSENTQLRRRRIQRKLDMDTKDQFVGLTAPARPESSGRGRLRKTVPSQNHSRKPIFHQAKPITEALIISDDLSSEGDETEDEVEHVAEPRSQEDDDIDELADENKENIDVPRTGSKSFMSKTFYRTLQSSPLTNRHRQHQRNLLDDQEDELQMRNEEIVNLHSTPPYTSDWTQRSAIADSQVMHVHAIEEGGELQASNPRRSISVETEILISPNLNGSNVATYHPELAEAKSTNTVPASPPKSNAFIISRSDGPSTPSSTSESPRSFRQKKLPSLNTQRQTPAETAIAPSIGSPRFSYSQKEATRSPPKGNIPSTLAESMYEKVSSTEGLLCTTIGKNRLSTELARELRDVSRSPLEATNARIMPSTVSDTVTVESRETKSILVHQSSDSCAPESSIKSTENLRSNTSLHRLTNSSTAFETAPTSLTPLSNKIGPNQLHELPQNLEAIDFTHAPLRSFAQIVADPYPPNLISEADVDINLFNSDDERDQQILNRSSPAEPITKRRRGNDGRVLERREPGSKELSSHDFVQSQNMNANKNMLTTDELAAEHTILEKENSGHATGLPTPSTSIDNPVVPKHADQSSGSEESFSKTRSPVVNATDKSIGRDLDESNVHRSKLSDAPFTNGSRLHSADQGPGSVSNPAVIAPNQVFAGFNGRSPAYYPATCIGFSNGKEPRYKVRFDDGNVDEIGEYAIKRLELRTGDIVKACLDGVGKVSCVVRGFEKLHKNTVDQHWKSPKQLNARAMVDLASPPTDIFGNSAVVLVEKKCVLYGEDIGGEKQLIVPFKDIYLTKTLWRNFKDRNYSYFPDQEQVESKLQNTSETSLISSNLSPRTIRAKHTKSANLKGLNGPRYSRDRLFENVVVAITNVSESEDRKHINRAILDNGGCILEKGFDELFDIPDLALVSSQNPCPKQHPTSPFALTETAKRFGFVCLIADSHCRNVKYIQALSLGIPCLATRWIRDCLAKQEVLPWETYLLASGESSFLGKKAVRSRILPSYPLHTATLPTIIEQRPKLLNGHSLLLIMTKAHQESMNFHPFFTLALGASKVARAASIEAAAAAIAQAAREGDVWDYVYSHNNIPLVEEMLFGTGSVGKKRKRGRVSEGVIARGKTKVVDNEFVIQSIILGRLADLD